MSTLVPVLLAGGSGTRLWPSSRTSYPKQFLDLTNSGESFLQATLKRTEAIAAANPWIIITGEDYRFLVAQQAQESGVEVSSILLEPMPRNTAPAIALAALEALALYNSPELLVQTADHYIKDLDLFSVAVKQAFQSSSSFVLFGVEPTHPETGYGYIECGKSHGNEFLVSSFKEKPDLTTAENYLKLGNYLWTSGMFVLDAQSYLDALKTIEPTIYTACEKAFLKATNDLDFKRLDSEAFGESPAISIDYAVMERVDNLRVVPYRGDWSDVGAWDSVASLGNQDEEGNIIQGDGVLLESTNTMIRAESRLVTGIGLHNLIVIETRDAVLVADSSKTQDVKHLVDTLKAQNRKQATEHREIHRPWGRYETLVVGDQFQVKQIIVNPGASLSLQMHHHRSEHWVVVSGTAEVQVEEKVTILTENQSVYIPVRSKHRLTNPGKFPLTLIEVQLGSYLGEDDIVRYDDQYGRIEKQ
jgi:mannose-1-phosphate guanylyltransferase/mannose-6-phosphate isomerase